MRRTTFHLDVTGLDEQTASAVTDYLVDLVHQGGPVEFQLDFRRVEWIGSAALGTLIGLNRRVAGRLVLTNVSEPLADVLRLTRLDCLLHVQQRAVA
jgi:anti-anti-sigma factor